MAELTNNFNFGSDTNILTSNSGGSLGNAWNTIFTSSGSAILQYSTDAALHGVRGALCSAPASGNNAQMGWTTSWAASTVTYSRMYFKVNDATPALNVTMFIIRNSTADAIAADVRLTTGGLIQLRPFQTAPAGIFTSTTPVQDNSWVRLEVATLAMSSTSMRMAARVYYSDVLEGSSPSETLGSLTGSTRTGADYGGTFGGVVFGISSTTGQTNWTMHLDSVGLSDVDWLGSIAPPPPAIPTGLTATPVSASQIDLAWDAFSGAAGYDIERNGTVAVNDHVGTSYNDTGLSTSSLYEYRVRAVF